MENELNKDAATNAIEEDAILTEPEKEPKDIQSENSEGNSVIEEAEEGIKHDADGVDSLKKKKVIRIAAITVAAIIVIAIGLFFTIGNKIVAIEATYELGDAKAGVTLDNDNSGISVIGMKRFGGHSRLKPGEWTIASPVTLEKDKTSTVIISYKDLTTELIVECSDSTVVDFDAVYEGDTSAGVEIKDQSQFKVTVKYKNGKISVKNGKGANSGWHITEAATLEPDSSTEIEMVLDGIKKTITIECTDTAVVDFDAVYEGDTSAGVEINDQSQFKVTVKYGNGKTKSNYKDWHIVEPKILVAESNTEVEMVVGGISKTITIKCSTPKLVKNGRINGTLKDIMTQYINKYGSFKSHNEKKSFEGELDLRLDDGAYGGDLVCHPGEEKLTIVFQGVSSNGESLLGENEVPGSIVILCEFGSYSQLECMCMAFGNMVCTLDPSISQAEAFNAFYQASVNNDTSVGNIGIIARMLESDDMWIVKLYVKG